MTSAYKMPLKSIMNPYIHLDLNLKESRKYARQGRTYTSSIMNLEIVMWFVYKLELDRIHRQLGIFAACEREMLSMVRDVSLPLDQIKMLTQELGKTDIPQEKRDALETVMKAGKSAEQDAYLKFWDMRMEIDQKSRKLQEDAVKCGLKNLKDACKELKPGELLHAMHDAFRDCAGKLDEAVKRVESAAPDKSIGDVGQEKVWELTHYRNVNITGGDKEEILFTALKECMKQVRDNYKNAETAVEKAAAKYDRIERRMAEKEKSNGEKREEERPSVRKKMELLQMQQPERRNRVAEEKSKGMMR